MVKGIVEISRLHLQPIPGAARYSQVRVDFAVNGVAYNRVVLGPSEEMDRVYRAWTGVDPMANVDCADNVDPKGFMGSLAVVNPDLHVYRVDNVSTWHGGPTYIYCTAHDESGARVNFRSVGTWDPDLTHDCCGEQSWVWVVQEVHGDDEGRLSEEDQIRLLCEGYAEVGHDEGV